MMNTVTLNNNEAIIANAMWTLISQADENIKKYLLMRLQGTNSPKEKTAKMATVKSEYRIKSEDELSPKIRQLIGIIPPSVSNEDDNKRIREQYLKEKFGI